MNNENLFTAALNALTNNGCPSDLAQEAAYIVANDDPYQPDLGRTPEQQQIIQETLPYLQSGIYDQFETNDITDDATRDKANNIFTRLEELGAWE
ncbi:hypothetical protein [Nostoc parmelioides]|uniref:Uncharacterized protein n=1 Tax=Nostoc parmelioides FACHB-3921 TaxID=2692909 RepID=A0ABR8BRR0_9NOSO|nr:hypothetical protein [Nostoc parmelioides]MBD2255521.1 hypothetical protein [Nostoc parmelioides FACHB-3921]